MDWTRFVALGDSFTEGIGDPGAQGRDRGWADRVAEALGVRRPDLRYANLAVRGRRLGQIVTDQVPPAVRLQPDLITLAGGINDALALRWDLGAMARMLLDGVAPLAGTGARVVIITYGRPANRSRMLGLVQSRLAAYRDVTLAIAQRYGCQVVDFWDTTVFDDPRLWSADRLHLNTLGHERIAAAVLEALGVPSGAWRDPLPPAPPMPAMASARADLHWAGEYLWPWLCRRARGKSLGDAVTPKRPLLEAVAAPAAP